MPTSDSVKLRRNSLPSAVIRSSSVVLRCTAMPSGSTSSAAHTRYAWASAPAVSALSPSVSTALPNGPAPAAVCAVTKMPRSASSALATRMSNRSAAQARKSTGANVSGGAGSWART